MNRNIFTNVFIRNPIFDFIIAIYFFVLKIFESHCGNINMCALFHTEIGFYRARRLVDLPRSIPGSSTSLFLSFLFFFSFFFFTGSGGGDGDGVGSSIGGGGGRFLN